MYGGDYHAVPWETVDQPRVFRIIRALSKARLEGGLPVILDETHMHAKHRRETVSLVDAGTPVEYWIIDRTLDVKIRDRGWRPEKLIRETHEKMVNSMVYALQGDGLDNVVVRDFREVI